MTGRSHLIFGIASVLTAVNAGWIDFSVSNVGAAAFGSLLPDLDTERSMLGARMRWLSRVLAGTFGHRTITHTFCIPVLIALAAWYRGGVPALHGFAGALAIGYASHILGDLPTGGCWAFYPFSRSRISCWPYARVGGVQEFLVLVACLGALAGVVSHHGGHVSQGFSHAAGGHDTRFRTERIIA